MADQAEKPDQQHKPRSACHVAVIMDGNGRWAKQKKLPRHAGHTAGVAAARRAVEACAKLGVTTLTLFAFSSENWNRPLGEVRKLMTLFVESLNKQVPELNKQGVRLRIIGDRKLLPDELVGKIEESEKLTRHNSRLNLVIAVAYGGRWDIVHACRGLASRVASGELMPEDIGEEELAEQLQLAGIGDPDLFIRTGGESRISNFLLWNLAYAELYFTDVLWPDFDQGELERALDSYRGRERRFGKTAEQLSEGHA
jgi:undecaprenyl diphosphate synthase